MDYCSRNYVQGLFPAYCHPCLEPWALMSFFTGASLATLASRVNQLVHWNLRSLGLLHHPHGSQSRFFFSLRSSFILSFLLVVVVVAIDHLAHGSSIISIRRRRANQRIGRHGDLVRSMIIVILALLESSRFNHSLGSHPIRPGAGNPHSASNFIMLEFPIEKKIKKIRDRKIFLLLTLSLHKPFKRKNRVPDHLVNPQSQLMKSQRTDGRYPNCPSITKETSTDSIAVEREKNLPRLNESMVAYPWD